MFGFLKKSGESESLEQITTEPTQLEEVTFTVTKLTRPVAPISTPPVTKKEKAPVAPPPTPPVTKEERAPAAKKEKKQKAEKSAKLINLKKPSKSTQSLRAQKKAARENARKHSEKLKQLDKKAKQQNAVAKKKFKFEAAPKNTSQQIKYDRMFDSGVCEIEKGLYSRTVEFTDINYQTARQQDQEDLFERYCELLNYFDPNMHLQISIVNRRVDSDALRVSMADKVQGDAYDAYRMEFGNMIAAKAQEGQNSIRRSKYLTFTTAANSYEMAGPALSRIESDIATYLKTIGSSSQRLEGLPRLGLFHEWLRPEEPFTFKFDQLVESNLTTKEFIAPASFDFSEKDYFMTDDCFGQVLFIRELPKQMYDKVISELSDLPFNMNITLHIDSVDQGVALEYVRSRIAFMEMEATDREDKANEKNRNLEMATPMETRRSYDEAKYLLDLLDNHDQHMFKVTALIYVFANDLETLQDNAFQVMATARKNSVIIEKLSYMQREGLNSILPIGKNFVPIERTLTTASTAAFIPFTTQELYQPWGMYYGLNALSRNLILFSRYSLKAPNGMILGTPGSGKSFSAKREIVNVLLNDPNAEVLVVDPEREYTALANGFDGEVVHVSAGSQQYINPMDITMDYADDDDPLSLKSEFVMTICDLLIGGKNGLSGAQRSIISRACKLCYLPYFASPGKTPVPTLRDFYKVIKEQPEPEARELALDLELYIDGTLSVFSNPTNVNTQKRFVVYDVRDLGKQLRTFGMIVVLDQIWNKITRNRALGKRTWIYIDEIQLLFSNDYSANYFFELWSRSRKWGAIPTGITQNVETLLLSDLARRMLSNSDFIMMLNQATSDRVELAGLLNISEKQLGYVTNSSAGQGLLFAGSSIVPFVDDFPKDTQLYKMMTTKIEEVSQQEEEPQPEAV